MKHEKKDYNQDFTRSTVSHIDHLMKRTRASEQYRSSRTIGYLWISLLFCFVVSGLSFSYAPKVPGPLYWTPLQARVDSSDISEGSEGRYYGSLILAYSIGHMQYLSVTTLNPVNTREDAIQQLANYPKGSTQHIFYNPASPESISLSPGFQLVTTPGLTILGIASGGLGALMLLIVWVATPRKYSYDTESGENTQPLQEEDEGLNKSIADRLDELSP